MATESPKRIVHDWVDGVLVVTEIEITEDEQNGEVFEPKLPEP